MPVTVSKNYASELQFLQLSAKTTPRTPYGGKPLPPLARGILICTRTQKCTLAVNPCQTVATKPLRRRICRFAVFDTIVSDAQSVSRSALAH